MAWHAPAATATAEYPLCSGDCSQPSGHAVPATHTTSCRATSLSLANDVSPLPMLTPHVSSLSPLVALFERSAMRQFRNNGTTGDVSALPYAAMAANGAAWTAYGLLNGDYTIMLPNASGFVLGAYYCSQFYIHRAPGATVIPYFGGAAAFVASVGAAASALPAETAKLGIGCATQLRRRARAPDHTRPLLQVCWRGRLRGHVRRPTRVDQDRFARSVGSFTPSRLYGGVDAKLHPVDIVRGVSHKRPIHMGAQWRGSMRLSCAAGAHCQVWHRAAQAPAKCG